MGKISLRGSIYRSFVKDESERKRCLCVLVLIIIVLIYLTLAKGKDPRSSLIRGKLEGWVKIRLAGQTDWKRLWLVIQRGTVEGSNDGHGEPRPTSPTQPRKNRMSALFSLPHSPQSAAPQKPSLFFYASQKSKDRKKVVLTMHDVTQAFAVYPERPELISRSTLIKLEGFLGDEEIGGSMRSREGWLLIMPELEVGKLASFEMLRWLVGEFYV